MNKEVQKLMQAGLSAKEMGATDMDHMDAPAGAFNYVRIANFIAQCLQSGRIAEPVLDWGCGYGQVSWLLQRRGVAVVPCDVEERPLRNQMPFLGSMTVLPLNDPVALPFEGDSFRTVLSVGVLEHVTDIEGSLCEVQRVLRPDGAFVIFMLPNRFSWAEWLADIRGTSVHPVKFDFARIHRLLARHGFEIEQRWRRNFLPRNLTGLNRRVKEFYGRYVAEIERFDQVLTRVPPMCLFSGVLELVARKSVDGRK